MDFKQIQAQFVDHLRDPENTMPPKGIEPRRIKVYQDLLFNNIVSFITSAFPVTQSLYEEQSWLELVRTFFIKHKSKSPHFIEISKEFVVFLNQQYVLQDSDPECLLYLTHYEWLEVDVSVDTGVMAGSYYSKGPITSVTLVPSARLAQYPLPVHQITSNYQPSIVPDNLYYYLVFRDQSHKVIFKQVSAIVMSLLQPLIKEDFVSPLQLVKHLREQLPQLQLQQLELQVNQVLDELLQSGALTVHS